MAGVVRREVSLADPFPWTLEVALSGGGLRASAYALGALLYLVHSGLNTKVKNISSVSGGSITNAFAACNCDFGRRVELADFQKIAGQLARKIAFSGLLQKWESWAWGIAVAVLALALLVCLLVLAFVFVGSWLVVMGLLEHPNLVTVLVTNSPYVMAVALVLLLVLPFLFNFRSWPIDKWMETILPLDVTLGGLSNRQVDHVFCATDLTFGQPLFFSTADSGRIYAMIYGRVDAPAVPVFKAVRASAAFPPAIPPYSLELDIESVSGVDLKTREGRLRLWLTDGGAFNNFGTEWHDVRRELAFVEAVFFERFNRPYQPKEHRERYGQVQLVVNASGASDAVLVDFLRFPIIGFVKYVFRTMSVMYGSTLAGRSSWSESAAAQRMKGYPWKWLARYGASEEDELKRLFKDHSAPYDPQNDRDAEYLGALRLFVPRLRCFDEIRTFWGFVPLSTSVEESSRRRAWLDKNWAASKEMGSYWPETGFKVPTTFRKLGKEVTLKLIIEGYLRTREVLFWSLGFEGPALLQFSKFESLLNESD